MLPDGCAYLGSHPGLQEQVCEVGFHVPRTPHGLLGSFGVDDAATSAALNTLPKTRDNLRSNITCAKRVKQGVNTKQLVRGFTVHDRAGKDAIGRTSLEKGRLDEVFLFSAGQEDFARRRCSALRLAPRGSTAELGDTTVSTTWLRRSLLTRNPTGSIPAMDTLTDKLLSTGKRLIIQPWYVVPWLECTWCGGGHWPSLVEPQSPLSRAAAFAHRSVSRV